LLVVDILLPRLICLDSGLKYARIIELNKSHFVTFVCLVLVDINGLNH